ncbi:MAG: C40 family peptidase [Actinomycetota bacterium]
MRGSHTRHSILKLLVTTVVAILATSVLVTPAGAHEYNSTSKQRKHLIRRAKSAIGSPYRYGGTSRRGFDCSGFTRWTFSGHGENLPRTSSQQFNLAKRSGHKRIWKRKRLRRGDLVFHKTTSARVGHAGIYIGRGRFVSSTSSGGVRVRSIWDPYYWGRRWVGGVRTPTTTYRK